jgi:NADH:ubiquinone oxidoreductase subunit E
MEKNPKQIRVCDSRSCTVFGAHSVMKAITDETGLKPGEKNENYDVDWCGCLGWCSNSPNVEVDEKRIIMEADGKTIMKKIKNGEGEDITGEIIDILKVDNFLGDL